MRTLRISNRRPNPPSNPLMTHCLRLSRRHLSFSLVLVRFFLLHGDSGGGKSTFNLLLERILWKTYKSSDPIPLHINMPSTDNPQQDMIAKQLRQLDFSDVQYPLYFFKMNRKRGTSILYYLLLQVFTFTPHHSTFNHNLKNQTPYASRTPPLRHHKHSNPYHDP